MRTRRSRRSRVLENAVFGSLLGIGGALIIALSILASAAPLILAVLVLHWLGVF